MKRILFTSWYSGLGGGETDLLTLVDALDANKYDCHLLLPAEGQLAERWREARPAGAHHFLSRRLQPFSYRRSGRDSPSSGASPTCWNANELTWYMAIITRCP